MIRLRQSSSNKGFTIIELMIATTVFSVILLIVSATMLQIARFYQKGVTNSKTQEATRNIIDDIGGKLQFNAGSFQTNSSGPITSICIDKTRYNYMLNTMVSETAGTRKGPHAIWQDTDPGGCPTIPQLIFMSFAGPPTAGGRELVPRNMRVVEFNIPPPSGDLFTISLHLMAGDDDGIVNPAGTPPTGCKSNVSGGQYCANVKLETTVNKRTKD
jgi:prepilin-type N-terminal cleavage/methylation domain-containing protein